MEKAQGINSKSDAIKAMQNVGIDNDFIDNALKMLDTPKAKKLTAMAGLLGVNVGDVKSKLNDLKTGTNTTFTHSQKNNSDPLASLKSGLNRRK